MSQVKRIVVNTVSGDNLGDFLPPLVTHDDYRIAAAKTVASLYSLADDFPEIQEYVDYYERHELFTLVLRGIVSRNMRSRWNNHNIGTPGGRVLSEDRVYYRSYGLHFAISIRGALSQRELVSAGHEDGLYDNDLYEALNTAYTLIINRYADKFLLA